MIFSEGNRDVTGDPQPDPSATVPAFQGMSLEQDGARHDLQTHRGRRERLAPPRWPQPVAAKVILGVKFTDGIEVVRSQAQAATLISSVTKIRR
jgi:hypothetical protein